MAFSKSLVPFLMCVTVAASAFGCVEELEEPVESQDDETGTVPTDTEDSTNTGPAECPDNPDPECTTSNACGNGEICAACECVPIPDDCSDPAAANCADSDDCGPLAFCSGCVCQSHCEAGFSECLSDDECPGDSTCGFDETDGCICSGTSEPDTDDGGCFDDEDCASSESCVEGECVDAGACECGADNPCGNPLDTCDGCDCLSCGSGQASPVDPVGEEFPEVVVSGTMISADLSGLEEACADALCVVEISNGLAANVFFNALNDEVFGDPVFLVPPEGTIEPFGSAVLEVRANACNIPGDYMDTIFLQNADDLLELGPVDISITLTQL